MSILGLRGFATRQTLEFAIPNGKSGSGLTVLVGSNNAGKSTVLEALRALACNQDLSMALGKRNEKAGNRVEISLTSTAGETHALVSSERVTSETKRTGPLPTWAKVFPVPSRRTFAPYFQKTVWGREAYGAHHSLPPTRITSSDYFGYMLFDALEKQDQFNKVLARLIDPVPTWTIEQEDRGQHFVSVRIGDASHSTEGAGEGFVSLLFLVDAFYDIAIGDMISIDEPELSLYPAVQRALAKMIAEYAATKQIVIATHSPYFVSMESLGVGGKLVRVVRTEQGSEFAPLTLETGTRLYKASQDLNNPHMMGLDAREVFFLEDKVILTEGQEDVVFLARALESVEASFMGTLFGWGAGGADKIELIAKALHELRFQKVAALVDADKAHLLPGLQERFPGYHFISIPADDIRTKPALKAKGAKTGLLDDKNRAVRDEHRDAFLKIVSGINAYVKPQTK